MKVEFFLALILIFLIECVNSIRRSDMKLELVQVLFRHGARTVSKNEFNLYNYLDLSVYEPWGLGQLTDRGKRMEFNIGVMLNKRYKDFLDPEYRSNSVYGYSSNYDRTKMSLQLVLAGLYPPTENTPWNPFILWQPIPYVSTPVEFDVLLRSQFNPIYRNLEEEIKNTTEYRDKISPFSEFLNFISTKTGVIINSLEDALLLFDVLTCNEYMDLPLPDWYTPKIKAFYYELGETAYDLSVMTTDIKKIGVGLLIRTFIDNMNLNNIKKNQQKIYLYSGHDFNLAAFSRVHRIKEYRFPHFGDALIFEKLRDSNNNIFVRILLWTGFGNLITLTIDDHGEFCSIDDYLAIVADIIPSDEEIEYFIINQLKSLSNNFRDVFFRNSLDSKFQNY